VTTCHVLCITCSCCRKGGEDRCSNTLEESRAFNSQHSFREDQRMLPAAHSSDSTNSLFKARAMAHGRQRQSKLISRRIARLTRPSCREGRSRFQWIQQTLSMRFIRSLQWHSDCVVKLESHISCSRSKEMISS